MQVLCRCKSLSHRIIELGWKRPLRSLSPTVNLTLPGPPLNATSQNRRMIGVGRDLCGSSGPTPLPKQGHLQQAAQNVIQVVFEYLQRSRIHNLSGRPVPVLRHPQSEEVLPHVQTELPLLQFVPIAPCPVARHH